jgi:hypothetical protein
MSSATEATTVCIPDETSLPDGPYLALRYHFGMLLGEDDFKTEQRYHRTKMRLHNAWLHGAGVVWGFDVKADLDKRELQVEPGLALDPTGRELHLDVEACVDVGEWYDKHAHEVEAQKRDDYVSFPAHIEVRFCSCATRAVPAIADPCEGAEADTAYSRTFETVEIRLLPGYATLPDAPYPRLRLLFGLEDGIAPGLPDPDREEVLKARAEVVALPPEQQAGRLLWYLRHFAALDTIELHPAETSDGEHATPFPFPDDAGVALANVDVTLEGTTGKWALTKAKVDLAPRRSHVATLTIEELLAGRLTAGSPGGGEGGTDAGGPRITRTRLDRQARTIVADVSAELEEGTVAPEAFDVNCYDGYGWTGDVVDDTTLADDGLSVTITLAHDLRTEVVRFIARGTGPRPLLGAAPRVPLAGGKHSPPGTRHDGHDYVEMFT